MGTDILRRYVGGWGGAKIKTLDQLVAKTHHLILIPDLISFIHLTCHSYLQPYTR